MHDERPPVEERVERVLTAAHPARRSTPAAVPFEVEAWQAPGEPVPFERGRWPPAYEPFAMGTAVGAAVGHDLVPGRAARCPPRWAGRRVEAVIDLGFVGDWPGNQAEALVYDLPTARPIKGVEPAQPVRADRRPGRGRRAGRLPGRGRRPTPTSSPTASLPTPLGDMLTAGRRAAVHASQRADLAVLDEEVWHLGLDLEVLRELMLELGEHDPRRHEILHALDRALDALDLDDVSGTRGGGRARRLAAGRWPGPRTPARTPSRAVGHAHIDTAWLWPLRETSRKTARTFANVTALADEYPEFVFACSQAQQYAWVKRAPARGVRSASRRPSKTGQWAPVGGMWVEADGNLPGGEALARQLVHGKRFFLEEFGVEYQGRLAARLVRLHRGLPAAGQARRACDWFLTQKISWNQTNKFPHHTFWWEGIDGTRIFTHFPPVDTYNASFTGEELAHAVRNYAEKGARHPLAAAVRLRRRRRRPHPRDAGAGPPAAPTWRARRRSASSTRTRSSPRPARSTRTPRSGPASSTWSCTAPRTPPRPAPRQGNRRSEHLLREAELWATTAAVHAPATTTRTSELDRLWKTVLLHQFHDILPGIVDRLGAPRGGGGVRAGGRRAGGADRPRRLARAGRPATPRVLQHQPARPGRGGPDAARRRRRTPRFPRAAAPRSPTGTAAPTRSPSPDRVLDNGLVRVEIDERRHCSPRYATWSPTARCSPRPPRQPAAAAHRPARTTGTPGTSTSTTGTATPTCIDAESVTVVEAGPLLGAIRVERSFGRLPHHADDHGAGRQPPDRRRDRDRLARGREDPQGGLPARRARRPVRRGDPVRPRPPAHAHQHQLGGGPVRGLRPPLGARRPSPATASRVINDSTYGHDVSRTARDGRRHDDHGPAQPGARAAHPGPARPTRARTASPTRCCPGATIADAVAEGYALNLPLRVGRTAAAGTARRWSTSTAPA